MIRTTVPAIAKSGCSRDSSLRQGICNTLHTQDHCCSGSTSTEPRDIYGPDYGRAIVVTTHEQQFIALAALTDAHLAKAAEAACELLRGITLAVFTRQCRMARGGGGPGVSASRWVHCGNMRGTRHKFRLGELRLVNSSIWRHFGLLGSTGYRQGWPVTVRGGSGICVFATIGRDTQPVEPGHWGGFESIQVQNVTPCISSADRGTNPRRSLPQIL